MSTVHDTPSVADLSLEVVEEVRVRASLDEAFAALLEELGPGNRGINDTPMPMVLEARPGGRWFRDLGDGNGHLWGHVQAVRRPTLLEIAGPLMMSFAVANNVQYRLKAEGADTVITLRHTALGLFPDGFKLPLSQGWKAVSSRLRARFAVRA
ncbi:MAG: SRPBCC domain-containing protein [Vicinamibacterales bacterium]